VADDITVVDDDRELGEASVSVSIHESESDRDSEERDREETKRLLYVALTRARDRLYLAGTATGGKLNLQRGSLGRILPAGLVAQVAASADADLVWTGRSAAHRIRRLTAPSAVTRAWRPTASARQLRVDLEPFEAQKVTPADELS
jgi:ATP-dependent exoDNAse (exonuclease V) beta subunit